MSLFSTTFVAATTISTAFTAYSGWRVCSYKVKSYRAEKKLLHLGSIVYQQFNSFYARHLDYMQDGVFMPSFFVKSRDGTQHTLEYYTGRFDQKVLNELIMGASSESLSLYHTILGSFDAIQKFASKGITCGFNDAKDYEILLTSLPKKEELINQILPIMAAEDSSWTATIVWALATLSSLIAYVVTSDSDSEGLSGVSHDEIQLVP